jgi:hypothetical protein
MPSLAEGNRLAVCYFPHATGEPASFPTGVKVIMTSFGPYRYYHPYGYYRPYRPYYPEQTRP